MFNLNNMRCTDFAVRGMEHPANYCGGQMVYFWSADMSRPELVARTWYYHALRFEPAQVACRLEIKLPDDGRYGVGRGKHILASNTEAYDNAFIMALYDALRPVNQPRRYMTIAQGIAELIKAISRETGHKYLLTSNSLIPVVIRRKDQ
ncbi:MAG: hypothetical protein HDQ88_09335 [Clostridia bacterium]|nr:hypothetical protein [Clostridia bacterium]